MAFEVPRRRILSQEDLDIFHASPAYTELISFIEALNDAIIGRRNSSPCPDSEPIAKILALLEHIQSMIDRHEPVDNNASRFGNPAFKDFYDDLASSAAELHPADLAISSEAVIETSTYLIESFGNRARIDYGSGHELNFLCWLQCLHKLHFFEESDFQAIVLKVFWAYIGVMRKLQVTYWLEPAGSHGVWGLDDYHFLPFLFGAAQLRNHKYLRPKSIHDNELLDMYAPEYQYLNCIKSINSIKTASLRWHSPMLDDISGAKSWEKVNLGMIKMYKAEVLGKVPIMQHFMFGSLIRASEGMSPAPKVGEDGMEHVHNTWADCCGIKVPSAIAAKQAEGGQKIRRMDWG